MGFTNILDLIAQSQFAGATFTADNIDQIHIRNGIANTMKNYSQFTMAFQSNKAVEFIAVSALKIIIR